MAQTQRAEVGGARVNSRIRKLAVGLLACYLVLFVQLNVIQVAQQDSLAADPRNSRQTIRDFNRMRGPIVTADGVVIAQSRPTSKGSTFKFQREYPQGKLFGNVTGYYTLNFGSTQLEDSMNDVLMGDTPAQDLQAVGDLFKGENFGSVKLTLRADLQAVVAKALGNKTGSVVVMEPRTGRVLAMVNNPRYDPNLIVVPSTAKAEQALNFLLAQKTKPLLDRTYQENYMPGSSFKIITTGIALQAGVVSLDTTFPDESSFVPPQTKNPIQNFKGHTCGGSMLEVFYRSCNISFARIALAVGPQGMVDGTKAWGVGEKVPIDLPSPAASRFGDDARAFAKSLPLLAIGGFGQGNDVMVPMHMAMVASTVANGGVMMKPYVVDETLAHNGAVLTKTTPQQWKRPISSRTADILTTMMIGVVNQGTGRKMKLANGIQAAAKTGTAQLNATGPEKSNAWIVGFAPADAPRYAVAVVLKGGENDEISESTGGTLAGPIAKQILDYLFAHDGR